MIVFSVLLRVGRSARTAAVMRVILASPPDELTAGGTFPGAGAGAAHAIASRMKTSNVAPSLLMVLTCYPLGQLASGAMILWSHLDVYNGGGRMAQVLHQK